MVTMVDTANCVKEGQTPKDALDVLSLTAAPGGSVHKETQAF